MWKGLKAFIVQGDVQGLAVELMAAEKNRPRCASRLPS